VSGPDVTICSLVYVGGHRRGQPCPYRASAIVNVSVYRPFRVCGYHARAYAPEVVYPLVGSLARVRRVEREVRP
jgi:hypothetical protein